MGKRKFSAEIYGKIEVFEKNHPQKNEEGWGSCLQADFGKKSSGQEINQFPILFSFSLFTEESLSFFFAQKKISWKEQEAEE